MISGTVDGPALSFRELLSLRMVEQPQLVLADLAWLDQASDSEEYEDLKS